MSEGPEKRSAAAWVLTTFCGLTLGLWVLTPVWVDAPVWAWGCGLVGALTGAALLQRAAQAQAGDSGLSGHSAACAAGQALLRAPSEPALRRGLAFWAVLGAVACAVGLLGGWHHEEGWRTMRQDGKVWLTALMLAWVVSQTGVVRQCLGSMQWLPAHRWIGLWALACAVQMGLALACAVWLPRADLPVGAIPWATTVAIGVAAAAPWCAAALRKPLEPSPQPWEAWLLASACAMGVVAVVLSRSRAAWVVLPWVLWTAIRHTRRPWRSAAWMGAAAMVALGLALLYDAHQPVAVERGLRLLDLWQEWNQAGPPDPSTSIGSRRLMWAAAWSALLEHPGWGIGAVQRIALVQSVVPPALMPGVEPLLHVHQQFLNQALDHGLPGLIAAVCTAVGPLCVAWQLRGTVAAQSLVGVSLVHTTGLLFNANMTHGPYVFAWCLSLCWVIGRHLMVKPPTPP